MSARGMPEYVLSSRRRNREDPFVTCYKPADMRLCPLLASAVETVLRVVEALWSIRQDELKIVRWRHGPILLEYHGLRVYLQLVRARGSIGFEWGMWKGRPEAPQLLPVVALRQWLRDGGVLEGGVQGVSPRALDDMPHAAICTLRYLADKAGGVPQVLPARMLPVGRAVDVGHYLVPTLYVLLEPIVVAYDRRVPEIFKSSDMKLIAVGVPARVAIRATVRGDNVPSALALRRIAFERKPFTYTVGTGEKDVFEIRLHRRSGMEWTGETEPFPVVLPEPGLYMVEADLAEWSPRWAVCQRQLDGTRIGRGWRDDEPPNRWHGPLMALDPTGTWQVELNQAIRRLTWALVIIGVATIIATLLANQR